MIGDHQTNEIQAFGLSEFRTFRPNEGVMLRITIERFFFIFVLQSKTKIPQFISPREMKFIHAQREIHSAQRKFTRAKREIHPQTIRILKGEQRCL